MKQFKAGHFTVTCWPYIIHLYLAYCLTAYQQCTVHGMVLRDSCNIGIYVHWMPGIRDNRDMKLTLVLLGRY